MELRRECCLSGSFVLTEVTRRRARALSQTEDPRKRTDARRAIVNPKS